MTNQNEYLKSTKLITAHYGEEYAGGTDKGRDKGKDKGETV